jgi:cytochrome c553
MEKIIMYKLIVIIISIFILYACGKTQNSNAVVSKEYLMKCATCHNKNGTAPIGAPLKGLRKEDALAKLIGYKTGKQINPMMLFVKDIPDKELEAFAEEIGKL